MRTSAEPEALSGREHREQSSAGMRASVYSDDIRSHGTDLISQPESSNMTENRNPDWTDLLALADEVKADNGPGTKHWKPEGSTTHEVNDRVMRALRQNAGTIPGDLGEIPCLIPTTTGAKSGEPRSVPLFCQTVDGRLVLIGSMGGAPRNPPWYYNLVHHPAVTVEKDGETFSARAEVLEGAERDYFFKHYASTYPIFAEYQAAVSRVIPIVELIRI